MWGGAPVSSSQFVLAEQRVSPLCIGDAEPRFGFLSVVDIVDVTTFIAAFVENSLKVERHVRLGLTERNRNDGKPLSQVKWIIFKCQGFPASSHTSSIRSAMGFGYQFGGNGKDSVAGAIQIDLDQVDAGIAKLTLFFEIQVAPGPVTLFDGLTISMTVTTCRPDLRSMISMNP